MSDPMEQRRRQQLSTNFNFLLERIDAIHAALCPGKLGTWQMRADQCVEAAKEIAHAQASKVEEHLAGMSEPERAAVARGVAEMLKRYREGK